MGSSKAVIERAKKAAGQKRKPKDKSKAKMAKKATKKSSAKKSSSKKKKEEPKEQEAEMVHEGFIEQNYQIKKASDFDTEVEIDTSNIDQEESKAEISHSERAHSKLGASSAKRWMTCIGSLNLGRDIPEPPEGPWAKEGTHAHELSEQELARIFRDYSGVKEYSGLKEIDALDTDMAIYVSEYVRFIADTCAKAELVDCWIEKRLTLDEDYDMYGTGDFVAILKGPKGYVGLIIDLKYGQGVYVEGKGNMQLLYYSAAMLETFEEYDLIGVQAFIYQPRFQIKGQPPHRGEYFPREMLEEARDHFIMKADQAMKANPADLNNFVAGKHCKFCKCKGVCPTYTKMKVEEAESDFAEFDKIKKDRLPQLEHETVLRIIRNKKNIAEAIKIVENYCLEMAKQGMPIEGVKCVQKQSRQRWRTDMKPEKIAESLEARGIKEPFREPELITIGDAKKELGDDGFRDLVEVPEPKLEVVHEDDRRPGVDPVTGLFL